MCGQRTGRKPHAVGNEIPSPSHRSYFGLLVRRLASVLARGLDQTPAQLPGYAGESSEEGGLETATPPAPRAWRRLAAVLLVEAIGALAVGAFGGLSRSPHLLSERAAQEAADRMRLPACRLDQLLQCHAVGPLQQVENLGCFAAVAGRGGFLRGRGLSVRLRLGRRHGGASFGDTGLCGRSCGCGLGLFLRNRDKSF
jgi:hypothetical protein